MNNPITTLSRERLAELVKAIDCEAYDEEEIVGFVNSHDIFEMARALLAVMDMRNDRQQCVAWVEAHFSPGFIDTRLAKNGDGTDWMSWDMAAIWKVWHHFATPPAPSAPDGWIKCSDRMPDVLDWVIAYDEVGTTKAYLSREDNLWVRDNGDELYRVTHWMPLPAAPGGE